MSVKAMKASVRAKRSKAEMQQEFAEIQEQVESAREAADAKAEGAARLHAAEVRQGAEGITVEAVVQKISGLGLEVGKALADISEQLTQEVKVLATLREAAVLERKELEQLHKIDVTATALDQMVQDYAREKQRAEAEIGAQRQAWEEESARMERERKEQDDNLKKQRQREAELKGRDDELTHLRKEAEGFPARLQNEAETAALRVRRETEAKFEQEVLVLKKDADTEKRLAELHVRTLEETLARQAAQIVTLEKQLVEAKQQVQDIAVKAIEGASGSKALSHVNQIAMEQAKNRPQG